MDEEIFDYNLDISPLLVYKNYTEKYSQGTPFYFIEKIHRELNGFLRQV